LNIHYVITDLETGSVLAANPAARGYFDAFPRSVKRGILEVFPPGAVTEFYGASEGGFTRISAEEWLRKTLEEILAKGG